jgi:serine-type D-Ala-D-Ala carboxypeptidase
MSAHGPVDLEQAFAIIARGIKEGAYPGAVAMVGRHDGPPAVYACGHAALEPDQVPMQAETIFDLASLTKVVATTPVVLRLIEQQAIALDQPVQEILPGFSDPGVTVRHLLTHTSGLPGWRGLYLDHHGWDEYTAAICATALVRAPGTQVEYSDLGFMLLGAIVQQVTGQSLPACCQQFVFAPLAMQQTGWLPQALPHRFAATERGNQVEYGMCKERAAAFPRWRDYILCGEVNDGNAYYGLDGVSSHAGLFGTAADLARYAAGWLNGTILRPETIAFATRNLTPGMAENRALGWQKAPANSAGDRFSPRAFGHTGFTGTSLWIDPDLDVYAILLTNRLHPAARDGLMSVRRAFHEAVVASVKTK